MATSSDRSWLGSIGRALLPAIGTMLLLSSAGSTMDAVDLERALPRTYGGEFHWIGDRVVQTIRIRLNLVRRLDAGHIEAIGCGEYEVQGRVTGIGVQVQI